MAIEFNANIELLMGGAFCGHLNWSKSAGSIDNCFKFYYIRKGTALLIGEKDTIELKAGHIYFINGYKIKAQKCNEPFVVYWSHFQPKSLHLSQVLKEAPLCVELPLDDFNSFHHIFKQFKPYFNEDYDAKEHKYVSLEIQSLIQFVIAKVYRECDEYESEDMEQFKRLQPSIEYIAEHYMEPVSLQELAAMCHLSANYYHRIFNNMFKQSPLKYIQSLRMDEAIRQLIYTNESIKRIALNVGYYDEAYFSRLFSKVYKCSPGQYRKKHKGDMV